MFDKPRVWIAMIPSLATVFLGLMLIAISLAFEAGAQIREIEDLRLGDPAETSVPDWEQATVYTADQVVIETGTLYRRTVAGTSGVLFDANQWIQVAPPVNRNLEVAAIAGETSAIGGAQDLSTSRAWQIGLADDATLPGTGGVTVPTGTTAEEPAGVDGQIRYDSDTDKFRFFNGKWKNYPEVNVTTIVTAQSPYTVLDTDDTIFVNDTGATTVLLPPAASSTGRILSIKKIGVLPTSVTVDASGAEEIDAVLTQSTTLPFEGYQIQCDGTAWWILSSEN